MKEYRLGMWLFPAGESEEAQPVCGLDVRLPDNFPEANSEQLMRSHMLPALQQMQSRAKESR